MRTTFQLCFLVAIGCLLGCASKKKMQLVIVNQRIGYVKVLESRTSAALLSAVSRAQVDTKARSFDDYHGEGNWGGRMFDVYVPVRGDVYVRMFAFDSSGYYLEDYTEKIPRVRLMGANDATVAYRLLTPWQDEEEERLADQKEKNELEWGIFP
jgi:hypothetical protein